MKQTLLLFIGLIICNVLFAQQFNPSVISNGGGLMSNANAKLTFTIGEAVTGDVSNASAIFTQGFQQKWIVGTGIDDIKPNSSIVVYPNPASDIINIKYEKGNQGKTTIEIMDVNGRILLHQNMKNNSTETQINFAEYEEAIYYIRITSSTGKLLGTYKIQKIK